jgi:hypothetical protein
LSGEGTITVEGETMRQLTFLDGTGTYDGEHLLSDETGVRLSGSGTVTVQAQKELNAGVSGNGDIYYIGNPTITNDTVSGKGSITEKQ